MLWTSLLVAVAAGPTVDAYLPPHLRPAVAAAADAELDPKRGPANALQMLERAQREVAKTPEEVMTFKLRVAALELRRTFSTTSKLDDAGRHEQALSTYSRLDLTEPGFAAWLGRTLDHHPEVAEAIAASPEIEVAVLTRGPIERKALEQALRRALKVSGLDLKLAFVEPKEADYLLKLTAENITQNGRRPAIGLQVVLQSTKDDGVGAKQKMGRAIAAPTPEEAAAAGAEWVAHIGGRDLVARFLADRGLTMMVLGPLSGGAVPGMPMPGGHDGHDH